MSFDNTYCIQIPFIHYKIAMIRTLFLLAFFSLTIEVGFAQELSEKGAFLVNAQEEHHVLIVLANRPDDFPEVRTEVMKYIWKYFPGNPLKVTQIALGGDLQNVPLIHLQTFANQSQAMEFYNSLKKNSPDFMQMGMTVDYFALSKSNFEKLVRSKSLDGYKSFFEKNYLSNR